MKNIMKKFKWVTGLAVLLLAAQAQAAVIMSGSAFFEETNPGASTPYFSGTVYAEISGTAGAYTSTFWIDLDNGPESTLTLADITLSAWNLGPNFVNGAATSPGSNGGDPTGSLINCGAFTGCDALFTFGSGGLAQGSTSNSFWFTNSDLDLAGDSINFGITTVHQFGTTSASTSLVLTAVPLPAAVWLFGSGLLGLAGFIRRKRS